MTMTMDLFQLRAHEGQKIIGEILHTMIEHNKNTRIHSTNLKGNTY